MTRRRQGVSGRGGASWLARRGVTSRVNSRGIHQSGRLLISRFPRLTFYLITHRKRNLISQIYWSFFFIIITCKNFRAFLVLVLYCFIITASLIHFYYFFLVINNCLRSPFLLRSTGTLACCTVSLLLLHWFIITASLLRYHYFCTNWLSSSSSDQRTHQLLHGKESVFIISTNTSFR